ncbi:FK506-binding protein 2B [Phytophthora pseudosyringae]|uniref:FK506-binding protein 2B n=1 Tax=Phytophthora pseudosyringae TaxID=221518 RepID=A0A8T1VU78_9STRA|nr:FK506-binding protein 2B [Phytophthora pseudosyringae]
MPVDNDSAMAFLIPRCFRRKKTPPTPETAGNIFEQRMKQRLKKQHKRSSRAKHTRPPRPVDNEFSTFDLLAVRDRSAATKNSSKRKQEQWPQGLSWDSIADTYLSPPSSVGAEAGGIIGTTHTRSPCDEDPEISSRYIAQLTRQEVSQEAAFRLQQLAHLDMGISTPSFVYQVPRQSARKWSMATTQGSVAGCIPQNK